MTQPTRFSCGNGDGMFESEDGFWVAFSDYEIALNSERNLLQNMLNESIKKGRDGFESYNDLIINTQDINALTRVIELLNANTINPIF